MIIGVLFTDYFQIVYLRGFETVLSCKYISGTFQIFHLSCVNAIVRQYLARMDTRLNFQPWVHKLRTRLASSLFRLLLFRLLQTRWSVSGTLRTPPRSSWRDRRTVRQYILHQSVWLTRGAFCRIPCSHNGEAALEPRICIVAVIHCTQRRCNQHKPRDRSRRNAWHLHQRLNLFRD